MRGVITNGQWIRELRKSQGHSQEQLAALADCDVKTLRKAEHGQERVDLRVVVDLSRALGCEALQLIIGEVQFTSSQEHHVQVILGWHEAFRHSDIEAILPLHTEDTILVIPGAEGMPAAEMRQGIDQLREHFEVVFRLFKMQSIRSDDFEVHAVENLVFLRTTPTFEHLPSGKSFTTRYLNEFEFRDEKIARRVTIADFGQLRLLLE